MTYLDAAASTPVRPEAVAAMLPYLSEHYGNVVTYLRLKHIVPPSTDGPPPMSTPKKQ